MLITPILLPINVYLLFFVINVKIICGQKNTIQGKLYGIIKGFVRSFFYEMNTEQMYIIIIVLCMALF